MLRHKRNIKAIKAKKTHSEHVKLPGTLDALHPEAFRDFNPVQALRLRLQFNQHLNQRVTLCLELYHKNIIKKLTKNVCQT